MAISGELPTLCFFFFFNQHYTKIDGAALKALSEIDYASRFVYFLLLQPQ